MKKKKTIAFGLLLLLSFTIVVFIGNTRGRAGDNLGTPDHPFPIGNQQELFQFAAYVNDGHPDAWAALTGDVDLASQSWTPIGAVTVSGSGNSIAVSGQVYTGSFDGGGFTIRGLSVAPMGGDAGLFGVIGKGGVVKNLTVAGAVAGSHYLGGIAGSNYGVIEKCVNQASVSGTTFVGGIAGSNEGGTIRECANQGHISAVTSGPDEADFSGGITGYNAVFSADNLKPLLQNVYNTGGVSSNGQRSGGIAGYNGGTLENAYNAGAVSGTKDSGGIAGQNAGSVLNAWFIQGTHQKAFGLLGKEAAATVAGADAWKNGSLLVTANRNGNVFRCDVAGINGGYPILIWQKGESVAGFYDIPGGTWYASFVADLKSAGLINGKTETIFAPSGKITRAEFAKILALASGDDLGSYDVASRFQDVGDAWYRPYINWAYEKGVVNGKSATSFGPNQNITRQEMAVMMTRFAKVYGVIFPKAEAPVAFQDENRIASWAKEAVSTMQQAKILAGKGNGRFDPTGNATRAEASKIVSIFLQIWKGEVQEQTAPEGGGEAAGEEIKAAEPETPGLNETEETQETQETKATDGTE